MIGKIQPRIVKQIQPVRQNLKNATGIGGAGLAVLAGSSMSNIGSGPELIPTEMVIPGGLKFHEMGYYVLTHKLPDSVYERWEPKGADYVPEKGDQIITINKNGRYVGSVVEGPRRADVELDDIDEIDCDVLNIKEVNTNGELLDITSDVNGMAVSSDSITQNATEIIGEAVEGSDEKMSLFEIWKHLAGFPD